MSLCVSPLKIMTQARRLTNSLVFGKRIFNDKFRDKKPSGMEVVHILFYENGKKSLEMEFVPQLIDKQGVGSKRSLLPVTID